MLAGEMERERPSAVLAEVSQVRRPSPALARVTLAAPELDRFGYDGPDHLVRTFFPVADQAAPVLPATTDWWGEVQEMPEEVRPVVRNYTVRRYDPERREIDIDFVLHGDKGPATRWANRARPGQLIGLRSERAGYQPTPGADWQLIVGDETSLPAIGSIVESMPRGVHAKVFVEIAGDAEEQSFDTAADVELHWLHRAGQRAGTSDIIARTLRAAELPDGECYAWVAGESGMVTAVRRHLVRDRGVPKESIYFCGYWKHSTPTC
ncbi:NADPH-dependent ferric siderophore reductase [Crossiella equi]|uniref:NADPH-dependent ferric siderophore reductase n=2 Tax=Crossiella equi TaxID=130796 RepID=A0ABS5AFW6_9PSEU|nr:NADPH-dependent ferric siderophore reductase [Crossiella equi]